MADLPVHESDLGPFTMTDLRVHDGPILAFTMNRSSRSRWSEIRTYLIDVHTNLAVRETYAQFFDHIFLAQKDYVETFERSGFRNVHWLPLACDPEIHGRIESEPSYDVGFVGNLEQNAERKRLVLSLDAHFKMNDFRKLAKKEDLTKIYSRSKIVFNYAINRDVNMRVFEALAAGSLLMTNRMDNGIGHLLQKGRHFVEYEDEQSLFEQVEYFLAHDDERKRIAEAGRSAVVSMHTYEHRSKAMLDTILSEWAPTRTAKVRSMNAHDLRTAYGSVYGNLRLVDAAFDEFSTAWEAKEGRRAAARGVITTLLRRLNSTVKFSQLVKGKPR